MRFHKGPRGGERAHEKDQGQGNLVSTVAITNEKMLLTLHNENLAQVSTGISCSKIKAFPNVDIDTNVVQNWNTSRVLGQQWLIKATGFFLAVFFQCLFRLEKYVSPWVNTQFGTLCSFTPDLCEVKTFSLPFASFLPLLLVNCGFEKVFFSLSLYSSWLGARGSFAHYQFVALFLSRCQKFPSLQSNKTFFTTAQPPQETKSLKKSSEFKEELNSFLLQISSM